MPLLTKKVVHGGSGACNFLIDDAARRLCILCYTLEGDRFLAATAYSDWMSAIEHGEEAITGRVVAPIALPLRPKMRAFAFRLSPGNVIQKRATLLRSNCFEGASTL